MMNLGTGKKRNWEEPIVIAGTDHMSFVRGTKTQQLIRMPVLMQMMHGRCHGVVFRYGKKRKTQSFVAIGQYTNGS